MKASIGYALIGLAMARSSGAEMGRSARLHGAADQALAVLGETIEPLEGRLRELDCQRLGPPWAPRLSRPSMRQDAP